MVVRRKQIVKACTSQLSSLMIVRFDVSGLGLILPCRINVAQIEVGGQNKRNFPGKTGFPPECITRCPPFSCGAVIGLDDQRCNALGNSDLYMLSSCNWRGLRSMRDLRRREFFGRSLEIPGPRACKERWDLTWGEDGSGLRARYAGANDRGVGQGTADHDGQSSGTMAKRTRPESRCCGIQRSVAASPSHRALATGTEIRGKSKADVRNVS
jgi:hypothetical protein